MRCENCNQEFKIENHKERKRRFCSRQCRSDFYSLVGMRFNRLVAVERVVGKRSQAFYRCICDCGNETTVIGSQLKNNSVKSCGCYMIEMARERKSKIIGEGEKFGKWIVIKREGYLHRKIAYLCRCDCGRESVVSGSELRKGTTSSCGCNRKGRVTHGLSGFKWYQAWRARQRRNSDIGWSPEMEDLLRRILTRCVICEGSSSLEVDHLYAFNKGGKLSPGNTVILCRKCNAIKSDKDLENLPLSWRNKLLAAAREFEDAWNLL